MGIHSSKNQIETNIELAEKGKFNKSETEYILKNAENDLANVKASKQEKESLSWRIESIRSDSKNK